VGATTSPAKALQTVFEQKPDIVFLDVQMPEMSGIDFMQLLNGKCKVISARKLLTVQENGQTMDGDYILVNADETGKLLRINVENIVYVEGQKQ
jgi:two-component system, LytTR family, response regulator